LCVSGGSSVDHFLKLDGIIGDSKNDKHVNEIEVLDWQFVPKNANNPTGIEITKRVDRATPLLLSHQQTGRKIPNGYLSLCREDDGKEVITYWFMDVHVMGVSDQAISSRGRAVETIEDLTLEFGKYHESPDQPGNGSGAAPNPRWNVRGNRKF